MSENMVELEVDGVQVVLDVEADLAMGDISEDMDSIASQIGWYGRVLAAARRALTDTSDYSKFELARGMETQFARNPKVGVDKAKTAVTSEPDYLKHRRAISRAQETVDRLDAAYTALQVKADLLRSKGALMRSELDNTGMSTPGRGGRGERMSDQERRERMAEAMKQRRRPLDEEDVDDVE